MLAPSAMTNTTVSHSNDGERETERQRERSRELDGRRCEIAAAFPPLLISPAWTCGRPPRYRQRWPQRVGTRVAVAPASVYDVQSGREIGRMSRAGTAVGLGFVRDNRALLVVEGNGS